METRCVTPTSTNCERPSSFTGLVNRRVVLKSRPGVDGEPQLSNFATEQCATPREFIDGEVLVRSVFLSIDPALRCRMNENTGVHYLTPWLVGRCVEGLGGVGIIERSHSPLLEKGDIVCRAMSWPWQLYFKTTADSLQKLDVQELGGDVSVVLTCLGLTGLTALLGLREKGGIKPSANQTCVVSAAAGACGSLAGQIAKLEGCKRVVGICGSDEKCDFLTKTLKFDAAINYKTQDVDKRLTVTCPDGIQVYFDNVGGPVSDAVIRHMTSDSNIVLCGQIALYNSSVHYPPPLSENILKIIKEKRISRDRFLVLQYQDKFDECLAHLKAWIKEGKLIARKTVERGLENAPRAFISMMNGGNIGKQVVMVSDLTEST
ncbi:prostaglandin reductase 2-like [Dermacentor andersoni]|uniref:prostaglandin reductase 2-like n=1 Tax=Dermacentor andersoni TaxID=34620 RepID=UPI0021555B37|nr:prostaglandin reductase 2-like [Dermacentor andersoni]